MGVETGNAIVDKSFEFAIKIIEFSKTLESQKHFRIADQLFRSGTSIGANVRESQSPQSRKDFVNKLKIAAKEAEETSYWLELCSASEHLITAPEELSTLLLEIKKLLSAIISKSKSY